MLQTANMAIEILIFLHTLRYAHSYRLTQKQNDVTVVYLDRFENSLNCHDQVISDLGIPTNIAGLSIGLFNPMAI